MRSGAQAARPFGPDKLNGVVDRVAHDEAALLLAAKRQSDLSWRVARQGANGKAIEHFVSAVNQVDLPRLDHR